MIDIRNITHTRLHMLQTKNSAACEDKELSYYLKHLFGGGGDLVYYDTFTLGSGQTSITQQT